MCLCKIKYDSLNMFAYFSIHINNFNVKKSPKKKKFIIIGKYQFKYCRNKKK